MLACLRRLRPAGRRVVGERMPKQDTRRVGRLSLEIRNRNARRTVLVQTLRWLEWTVIMVQDESIGFVQGTTFRSGIIVLCVRWYLTFKLSSRDLVQMMAERGIEVTHTTILRWVHALFLSLRSAGVSTLGQWVGHGVAMRPILR